MKNVIFYGNDCPNYYFSITPVNDGNSAIKGSTKENIEVGDIIMLVKKPLSMQYHYKVISITWNEENEHGRKFYAVCEPTKFTHE